MSAPNLDAMSADDALAFWFKHQRGRKYREIFPKGGRSTKRATADLANYASNISTAKTLRLRGDIGTASYYESIAERIYSKLPEDARW